VITVIENPNALFEIHVDQTMIDPMINTAREQNRSWGAFPEEGIVFIGGLDENAEQFWQSVEPKLQVGKKTGAGLIRRLNGQ
jgi:hypothetical protein